MFVPWLNVLLTQRGVRVGALRGLNTKAVIANLRELYHEPGPTARATGRSFQLENEPVQVPENEKGMDPT
jgi:hypothetical protein